MDSNQRLVIGGGIAGLLSAYLLKKKFPNEEIILIEKEKQLGGLLKTFDYGKEIGKFDYGIHTVYETGNPELDELILSILPKNEWIKLSGVLRDYGGTYINKVMQSNSPYVDLRNLPEEELKIFHDDFLANFETQKEENNTDNAQEYLTRKYGAKITAGVFEIIAHKIYGKPLKELHSFFAKLLPLERIVLFNNEEMEARGASKEIRDSIAFPNQKEMPAHLIATKSAYYPKQYGMYRFVEAFQKKLKELGVTILEGTSLASLNESYAEAFKGEEKLSFTNVKKLYWTSGIVPAYLNLIGKDLSSFQLDKPVKTCFVNLVLNQKPKVDGMYYVYNMEEHFLTHRLSCPSSFCPASYADGKYRLTVEVILNSDLSEDEIEKRIKHELILMEVCKEKNILFSKVEFSNGGYPTISTQNIKALQTIKNIVKEEYKNIEFFGLMSQENLFLQVDILSDIFKRLR